MLPKTISQTCEYCRWVKEKTERDGPTGEVMSHEFRCRFNPPSPKGFPEVEQHDYCREWSEQ